MADPVLDDYIKWRNILWAEYQEKTALEWKFAYSLWAALFGIASVAVADKLSIPKLEFDLITLVSAILLINILHAAFLFWAQGRLKELRIAINEVDLSIKNSLKIEDKRSENNVNFLGKIPSIIQIVITVSICMLLFLLLKP